MIGGHFGIDNGVPRVFYNLDKLKIGDKVSILDDNGKTLTFVVREIRLFNRDADATSVFISNDNKAHLNLITCEGIWNKVNDSYPQRRVVFTDTIPSEGPVIVKPQPLTIATKPSLPETAGAPQQNPFVIVTLSLLLIPIIYLYSKFTRR